MELQNMISLTKKVNLCSYFLLPLIGLSEHSFGEGNFRNSFLDSEDPFVIYVNIYTSVLLPSELRKDVMKDSDGNLYLRYGFPELWENDVLLFHAGRYSKMSDAAKQCIFQNSGLAYEYKHEDQVLTDFRLLALNRSPVLKEEWRKHLYDPHQHCLLDEEDDSQELLEAPGDYMYLKKSVFNAELH